jgi:hypothetical protein
VHLLQRPTCVYTHVTRVFAEAGLEGVDADVAAVEAAVDSFEAATGRRPRILVAKMGQDGHDRCARTPRFAQGVADGRGSCVDATHPLPRPPAAACVLDTRAPQPPQGCARDGQRAGGPWF